MDRGTHMKLTLPIRQFLAEFYGTFILVFIGTGAIAVGQNTSLLGIAFAFSAAVIGAIYTLGHISGAHLNPAVSVAMFLDKRLPLPLLFIYIFAQILGAFFATLSLSTVANLDLFNGYGATTYGTLHAFQAIFMETFFTFILVYAILAISDIKAFKVHGGLIIGFVLLGLIMVGGPLTGASLNPARSLTPALFTGGEALAQLWVYVVGPLLGAALAALFYRFLKFKID
jgi:aquaporin Z